MVHKEPVLIIGAGLVGSTLAQALSKRGISYRIFERSSLEGREDYGWAVTLNWGVQHLQRLIPASIYESTASADANPAAAAANELATMTTFDLQTGRMIHRPSSPTGRRRVRRKQFGACLLAGINVEWSKQLASFSPSLSASPTPSSITATFTDGTTARGSVLVGCDGAYSTLRRLLLPSGHATTELPVRMMGATAVLSGPEAAAARAIDPMYFQALDRRGDLLLFFSFLDSPSNNSRPADQRDTYAAQIMVGWSADYHRKEDSVDDRHHYPHDPPPTNAERLALMRRWAAGWAQPFRGLVETLPDGASVNVVRVGDWLPPGGPGGANRWDNLNGRVTLAGDATHPMTMYRGEAFNHGLRDLEELVDKITPLYANESPEIIDGNVDDNGRVDRWGRARKAAIDEYEEAMLERAYSAVLLSRQACLDAHDQAHLNDDSPLLAHRSLEGPYLKRMEVPPL